MHRLPSGSFVKYKVITPKEVDTPEPELHIPEDLETTVVEGEKDPTYTPQLLKAGTIVAICMGLGAVLSQYMGQYITLPAYIGSMIVAKNRQKRRRFLRQIHGRRQGNERYRRNQLGAVRDDGH